jgi:histidine triad (HIT) family protein
MTTGSRPEVPFGAQRALAFRANAPADEVDLRSVADIENCPYCDVFAGTATGPPTALDEDGFVSFMGRFQPTGPGYSLVVPRLHVPTLHDLTAPMLAPALSAVRRVSAAILTAFDATGTTVMQNNGPPAQSVNHLHFHVVPRHEDDGYPSQSSREVPEEELEDQARRLRVALK